MGTIHPYAFRYACVVELLKRSSGNLRPVQEHPGHAGIQTTTIYTRLAPQDLQKVVNLFDENDQGGARLGSPSLPPGTPNHQAFRFSNTSHSHPSARHFPHGAWSVSR